MLVPVSQVAECYSLTRFNTRSKGAQDTGSETWLKVQLSVIGQLNITDMHIRILCINNTVSSPLYLEVHSSNLGVSNQLLCLICLWLISALPDINLYMAISLHFIIHNHSHILIKKKKKKKLHGLSPRANYTDRATAASRRSVANLCG
jgi:hypothetical protein